MAFVLALLVVQTAQPQDKAVWLKREIALLHLEKSELIEEFKKIGPIYTWTSDIKIYLDTSTLPNSMCRTAAVSGLIEDIGKLYFVRPFDIKYSRDAQTANFYISARGRDAGKLPSPADPTPRQNWRPINRSLYILLNSATDTVEKARWSLQFYDREDIEDNVDSWPDVYSTCRGHYLYALERAMGLPNSFSKFFYERFKFLDRVTTEQGNRLVLSIIYMAKDGRPLTGSVVAEFLGRLD